MDDKKKKTNYFKIIFYVFLIVYLSLYTLDASGYYQKRRDKVEFTASQIEKFEEDVNAGKNINIDAYLEDANKDYSNSFSKLGYGLSSVIDKTFNKIINGILNLASKFVN